MGTVSAFAQLALLIMQFLSATGKFFATQGIIDQAAADMVNDMADHANSVVAAAAQAKTDFDNKLANDPSILRADDKDEVK